jgi:predicted nucleic acid-binding Zn ribbon protein
MTSMHPQPNQPVTDECGPPPRSRARAATNRDRECASCGKPIAATDPLYIFGMGSRAGQDYDPWCEACFRSQLRRWRDNDHAAVADWYAAKTDEHECETCGRLVRADLTVRVCSLECRDGRRAAVRRRDRANAATGPIPETVTCRECGTEVGHDAVIVTRDSRHGRDLCEPCYTAARRDEDTERIANPGPFAHLFDTEDPAEPGWTPWRRWMAEIAEQTGGRCGWCERRLMGDRYCCDRCEYEAGKARRRVDPTEKTCVVCGKAFTPKRSDAKTCSDAHRQKLRRSRLVADRGGLRRTRTTDNRDEVA